MAELMEVVKERRSIRNYQDRPVPDEVLNQVLEAIRWSPSWANTQCWEVVVVRDPTVKAKLREMVPRDNPAAKSFAAAPVVLALCGRLRTSGYYRGEVTTRFGDWFLFDLGIATQNLCLTAHALGLGTVIVGLFDHDRVKEVLGVPDEFDLPVLIPLGYPSKVPKAPKRRAIEEFIHYDRF